MAGDAYKDAGVDIDAANQAVSSFQEAVRKTHGREVLAGMGAFAGLYSVEQLALDRPVLAATTDGVGTKVVLAKQYDELGGIGADLVHHCIGDLLTQGASPLFFLDHIGTGRLDPAEVSELVRSISDACAAEGIALLGGETAELPGVIESGQLEIVGTLVGIVERDRILDGSTIQPGDAVIALPSASPHTNGYSLVRALTRDLDLRAHVPGVGVPLKALLEPHRSYRLPVEHLRAAVEVRALAHLTGGGWLENPARMLPAGTGITFQRTWPVPPIYGWLQELGGLDTLEMHRVFNLGVGMLVVVPAADLTRALSTVDAWHVGEVTSHREGARVRFLPPL